MVRSKTSDFYGLQVVTVAPVPVSVDFSLEVAVGIPWVGKTVLLRLEFVLGRNFTLLCHLGFSSFPLDGLDALLVDVFGGFETVSVVSSVMGGVVSFTLTDDFVCLSARWRKRLISLALSSLSVSVFTSCCFKEISSLN